MENITHKELKEIFLEYPDFDGMTIGQVLQVAIGSDYEFKNIRKYNHYSIEELTAIEGIGQSKAVKIKAILEIAKRFSTATLKKGEKLSNSQLIFNHFNTKLRDEKREKFYTVLMDSQNRVIDIELISIGTLTTSLVHPREVFKKAIKKSAYSIILVHNHPSGECTPSNEDVQITNRLIQSGDLLGIRVLDHIIIGDNCYLSFSEQNYI